MPAVIACLDLDLPEFVAMVRAHARGGFETRFLTSDSPTLRDSLVPVEYLIVAEALVTGELIGAAPGLKLIQSIQVGYDNIDVEAARDARVMVANAAGINARSVAEHTLMLMLAASRRLQESDQRVHHGEWPQLELFQKGIHDLNGKTVGIVGFGNIGRMVAAYVRPLVGSILYYKRTPLEEHLEAQSGVTRVSLDVLLQESDVVTLHVPLTRETRGLIGDRELRLMRPGSILINTSRGAVVDESALLTAMREGVISAAALDVLWDEPPRPGSPLLLLDNVLLTPHVAAGSREVAESGFRVAFDNIYRVSNQQPPRNRVDADDVGVRV